MLIRLLLVGAAQAALAMYGTSDASIDQRTRQFYPVQSRQRRVMAYSPHSQAPTKLHESALSKLAQNIRPIPGLVRPRTLEQESPKQLVGDVPLAEPEPGPPTFKAPHKSATTGKRPLWSIGENHHALSGFNMDQHWQGDTQIRRKTYAPIIDILGPTRPVMFIEGPRTNENPHAIYEDARVYEEYTEDPEVMFLNACLSVFQKMVRDMRGESENTDWRAAFGSAFIALSVVSWSNDEKEPFMDAFQKVYEGLVRVGKGTGRPMEDLYAQDQVAKARLLQLFAKLQLISSEKILKSNLLNDDMIPEIFRKEFLHLLKLYQTRLSKFKINHELMSVILLELLNLRDYGISRSIINADKILEKRPNRPFVLVVGLMHVERIYQILKQSGVDLQIGRVDSSWDKEGTSNCYIADMRRFVSPLRRLDKLPFKCGVKPNSDDELTEREEHEVRYRTAREQLLLADK